MSREEWIKQFSSQAPALPEVVLNKALAQFGVKIKR